MKPSLLFLGIVVMLPIQARSQSAPNCDMSPPGNYWSEYGNSVRASSAEIYRDAKQFQEWERCFYEIPGSPSLSSAEALASYIRVADYALIRSSAETGAFADDISAFGKKWYKIGGEDEKLASLTGDVYAKGGPAGYIADKAKEFVTDPWDMTIGAGISWGVSEMMSFVLEDGAVSSINREVEKYIKERGIDAATFERTYRKLNEARVDALRRLDEAEAETTANDDQSNGSKNEVKANLISQLKTAETPEEVEAVAEKAEEDGYKSIAELAIDIGEFAKEAKYYTDQVNGIANAAVGLGVDLTPDTMEAISITATLTSGLASVASGNFAGGALALAKVFGSKGPDAATIRFEAIMGRLDSIIENQEVMIQNQELILKNQRELLSRIDELEWVVRDGFAGLEKSLQQSTELILEAIFRVDDRELGRCLVAEKGARVSFFPLQSYIVDIFEEPSSTSLSEIAFLSLTRGPNIEESRLRYFDGRFGEDLSRCKSGLRAVFDGLQTGRGIDPYFRLTRIDDNLKGATENDSGLDRSLEGDLEPAISSAKGYREIFQAQYSVFRSQASNLDAGDDPLSPDDLALLLAFSPRFKLSCQGELICDYDDALKDLRKSELERIERFFRGPNVNDARDILDEIVFVEISPPTLFFAVRRLLESHPYFALERFGGGGAVTEWSDQPDYKIQEETLRLLLQATQLLEVLRVQQAIMDGRAHTDIAWQALFSTDSTNWEDLWALSVGNAQFAENIARYIFYRAFSELSITGIKEYKIAFDSGSPLWVEQFLKRAFTKPNVQVSLVCQDPSLDDGTQPEARECSESDFDARSETSRKMHLSVNTPGVGQDLRVQLDIPLPINLMSDRFASNENAKIARDLHFRVRSALFSYRTDQVFDISSDADPDLVSANNRLQNFINYMRLREMGFVPPRVEEASSPG